MSNSKQDILKPTFSLGDFFTTQEQRDSTETIQNIKISDIDNFKDHPFKVLENEELQQMVESIKANGVLQPVTVRKTSDGRYEMISGHRRKKACEILGIDKIPAVVRELDNDQATIMMVDSNFQREKLLPSEKAFAYKMKYEALKHQGKTFGPVDQKLNTSGPIDRKSSAEILGERHGESEKTVRRYIRLTYLIPELLEYADNNELGLSPSIAFRPAVELSYLTEEEQYNVFDSINFLDATPSLAQAQEFKRRSQNGTLDRDDIVDILSEEKGNQIPMIRFNENKIKSVLPKNIQQDKIEDFVIKSIEFYTKHLRSRDENFR